MYVFIYVQLCIYVCVFVQNMQFFVSDKWYSRGHVACGARSGSEDP